MKNKYSGILLMLLSVIGFAVVQSLVKFLGDSVSSWTKAFFRSSIGLIFLLIWIILSKKKPTFKKIPLLIIRGLAGTLSLIFVFWTIDIYDLTHATLYLYTFPIFAPIFSSIFYKEKFHFKYLIPLVIAILGIFLVINPQNFSFSYKDIIGLTSGVLAGIAISTLKELRKTENSENIYLWFCVIGSIICSIGISIKKDQTWIIPLSHNIPAYAVWICLILLGFFATLAQLSMTIAYKSLSTSVGSILSLLTMPIITVTAILFFKEPYTKWTVIGGILIFISAFSATLLRNFPIKCDKI